MLTVSRCTTLGASTARRAGAGTPATTIPKPVAEMGKVNFVERIADAAGATAGVGGTPSIRSITVSPEPIPVMPDDLNALLEEADLMAEDDHPRRPRRRRGHHARSGAATRPAASSPST